jgi:hypothetical protein
MNYVRHCPRCLSDYQPHMAQCGECGGPLEDRLEGAEPRWEPPAQQMPTAPATLPPGEYHTLYFGYSPNQLAPLAERLTRRGIPFRIETIDRSDGRRLAHSRYELAVREQERETAREELLYLLGAEFSPDEARALDHEFDPEGGYRRCPGCSTDLNRGQSSCHECGLMLGGGDEG